MSNTTTKKCNTCGLEKLRSEFSKRSEKPDGLEYRCKKCYRERDRARYRAKRDAAGLAPRPVYDHCQHSSGCPVELIHARGLCKRHYAQEYETRSRTYEATCLAWRFGHEEPRVKPFPFRRPEGTTSIVAFCPWCGQGAHVESSLEVRVCRSCETRFAINVEEALLVSSSSTE